MGNSKNKGLIQPDALTLLDLLERNEISAETAEFRYFEVSALDQYGWSILHLAVYYGRVAAVSNILKSEHCKDLLDTPDAVETSY